jgi:hypothetical protein
MEINLEFEQEAAAAASAAIATPLLNIKQVIFIIILIL